MLVSTGKHMTSIGESNLPAPLDWQLFERLQGFWKDIHHSDLISKPNHNMEASGVEG